MKHYHDKYWTSKRKEGEKGKEENKIKDNSQWNKREGAECTKGNNSNK